MQNTRVPLSPSTAKYNNMRLSLLLIVIFSAVNLFSPLLGFYMLFSAYIPQTLAQIGAYLYAVEGIFILYVLLVTLALLLLVPYLLCWIFSKKNVGWMIAALVLFSVDTLLFLIDLVSILVSGEYTFFLDLIFHVYALVSLIMGVKYGRDMKNETVPDYDALASLAQNEAAMNGSSDASGETVANGVDAGVRLLTLTRKKSFVGCAMRMAIYVNGHPICELKNGESVTVPVPAQRFALGAAFSNALVSGEEMIDAGNDPLSYTLVLKSGFTSNSILFQPNTP
ncbi:MAG: hypothetical protein J6K61_00230 [Clostridia bacterium]|nr:hypothetical protein [Clostridia bacterium]